MYYFLSLSGATSVIMMFYGVYNLFYEASLSKTSKYFFNVISQKSEGYAKNSKPVLRAEELGVNLTATNYVFIIAMSLLSGIVFSLVFKNLYFIIIGIMIGYTIPEHIIQAAKTKKQKEYLFSSIQSVDQIAIEAMSTPNIFKAMMNALPNMEEPFKSEMQEIITSVNSGKQTLAQALDEMVSRTRSKHLKKVSTSIKFADAIGGHGSKMLQQDANLFFKDKLIYEKAEVNLKRSKRDSLLMSLLQLAPLAILRISLQDLFYFVMEANIFDTIGLDHILNIKLGPLVIFLVLVKIIIDYRFVLKKTRSLLD